MIPEETLIFPTNIEINPEFHRALAFMEDTDRHVFVTGRAGTGKSTLLTYWRARTSKPVVVLAPTGVAALNVGGQTIHSFFGFKPDITPAKLRRKTKGNRGNLYRHLATIVIDEISMVRADLLDCVDRFLRLHGPRQDQPFGGVQMIFIGDLYQLPPVVTRQEKGVFHSLY
ncbi:MAG: AAA family ATPase, partial [Syntrophales bacterium]|nr:AAA family ATPase [Syntrophales bacterium]